MTTTLSSLSSLRALAKLLTEAHARADERAKATHERFNVFTTLLGAHDEVRLHTRFLHTLLNPHGTHDCGQLFLELFFETLAEHPPLDHDGTPATWKPVGADAAWCVSKECSMRAGQIDLLLESTFCGIAIENKIWAAEQANQLERYARSLRLRHGTDHRLLYLTPHGRQAASHGSAYYLRISYARHILAWLEKCLRSTYRFIPINQVLLQYRDVVRQITGKTVDITFMSTIADFILENHDILRQWPQIVAGVEQSKVVFLDRLAEAIVRLAPPGFEVRPRPDLGNHSFGSHLNGALVITPPAESPLRTGPFEIWLEHISKWYGLVVGIECKSGKRPLTDSERSRLQKMNMLLDEHSKSHRYHKADPHVLWDGTEWPTGWHDLIPNLVVQRVAELLASSVDVIVGDLWTRIQGHVALLEEMYLKAGTGQDLVSG